MTTLERDIRYAFFNFACRRTARFMLKHRLWWNAEDKERWLAMVRKH